MSNSPWNRQDNSKGDDEKSFLFVLGGTALLCVVAYGLSLVLNTPLLSQMRLAANDIAWGVIATVPLALFLYWFSLTNNPPLRAFRNSQIEFFAKIGFEFTPLRVGLMAIAAGVSEELLFRGVLQTWLAEISSVAIAIVATNLLFGILHFRTALYALIAGLVGAYLGVLYAFTDNLIAPIITHGLYDALALEYTRRAVRDWNAVNIQT